MSKVALCFKRKDISDIIPSIDAIYDQSKTTTTFSCFDFNRLTSLDSYLLDRSDCEKDTNYLQIIPYTTLVNEMNNKIFVYSRGDLGNEKRLVGKCSVGLGGHVEEEPDRSLSLSNVIIESALRELEEEVGLELDFDEYINFKNEFTTISKILYSDIEEVGNVHLGISSYVKINPGKIKNLEKDIIERGRWLSYPEIRHEISKGKITLENWSNVVINN